MKTVHKAFILGAGLGTRLRPLTDLLPKPLVPYRNEPFIFQALRHCRQAGIDSFAINTHHLADTWEKVFPEHRFDDCPVQFFHEPVLLETGGGLKNIESWIGAEPVLVYNGDILTDLDLGALIAAHQQSGNLATLAVFSEGPNCNVAVRGEHVVDMRHALGVHPGTHQFTGIYIIEPELLQFIPANEKVSVVPAFLEAAKLGKLGAHLADGAHWQDLGSREEYQAAHFQSHLPFPATTIDPSAEIHPSAEVDSNSCFIGAHCVIEKGAKLRNTIAWPAAKIAENAQLDGCIVRQHASGTHKNADL